MSPEDIAPLLKSKPSLPLRLYLSDGSSHLVDPEQTFVWRFQVVAGVEPDEAGLPTRAIYISPDHVTRIEPIPETSDPGRGGQRAS